MEKLCTALPVGREIEIVGVDGDTAWTIIDFTDYTRTPVPVTPYNLDKNEDISYVTGRNIKLQPIAPLTAEEIQRTKDRLKEIYFAEEVNYQ